jgi:hypothetical protein
MGGALGAKLPSDVLILSSGPTGIGVCLGIFEVLREEIFVLFSCGLNAGFTWEHLVLPTFEGCQM